jgi:hypothetical protein
MQTNGIWRTVFSKFLLTVTATLVGCQSIPPYTCQQSCALRGMVCQGESVGSSAGGGIIVAPSGQVYSSSTSGASQSFHCSVPKTDDEKSQLTRFTTEANDVRKERERAKSANNAGWVAFGVISLLIVGLWAKHESDRIDDKYSD